MVKYKIYIDRGICSIRENQVYNTVVNVKHISFNLLDSEKYYNMI